MKIGILTSVGITFDAFFPPLAARMQELGYEVVSAASTPSKESPSHQILKTVTRTPSILNIFAPREITRWVESESIDVLITNTATASFLARVKTMPTPVIYFCHGLHWNRETGLMNRAWQGLESFAVRNTDAVLTINDDDDTWFRKRIDPYFVYKLRAGVGVPLDKFPRSPIPPLKHKITLLWAGEFSKRKRPWLAVELVHQILKKGGEIELIMCGDGPYLDSTAKKIKELGVEEAIILAGHNSNIASFLADSHALLLTSEWEGLPRIGLEAIAVGRPVFAFDVKGTRSLPDVMTVPDHQVEMLADLIYGKMRSGLGNYAPVDPIQLNPNTAADGLIELARRVLMARKG